MKNLLKRRICILLFLAFAMFGSCYGTTAVFVITPQGIVAGADQLSTIISPGGAIDFTATDIPKIELINQRFIVASVGMERLEVQGGVVAYSFGDWIRAIGNKLPENTSLWELVAVIKDEAARTFKSRLDIEGQMRAGRFKKSPMFQVNLVEYIVGGYDEAGVPTIVSVEMQLDWYDRRLIGPIEETHLPPRPGANVKSALYVGGENCASSEFINANSYAYKRFHLYRPATLDKFVARQPLTREDATDTIRVLIEIQSEITPGRVGGATRIVWLPVKGAGSAADYAEIRALAQKGRNENEQTQTKKH